METFELKQSLLKQRCLTCNQDFEPSDNLKTCPADGTMLSPVFDDPFIGTLIDGKYEVVERIATGTKAKIYKAKHLHLDKFVALKVLQVGISVTQSQVARFQKEAQVAVKLIHPNIVRVYDYGTNPQPYIAMEYVDGKTLAAIIKESGPLPAQRALAIFIDVANAMSAAHAAGLVHRDLKPSNVIIDAQSGQGKVLDFGLVKDFIDDAHYTKTGDIVGSPSYMSPEQWKGLPLDGRSDIYSFGCLMYEVLTGIAPFAAGNPVECMYKHLEGKAPKLSKARRGLKVPRVFDVIIGNCLVKEADVRYHSMADLKQDLLAIQAGKGSKIKSLTRARSMRWIIGGWVGIQVVLFLLCLLFLTYQSWVKPQWEKDYQLAYDLDDRQDYQGAIRYLLQAERETQAAHVPPADLQEIYAVLGRAYLCCEQYDKARDALTRAVDCSDLHPETVRKSFCHILLSEAYCKLKAYDKALDHGRTALAVAARQSDNTNRLGWCREDIALALMGLHRYSEAAQELEQARVLFMKKLLPMKDRSGNPFYDTALKFITDNLIPPGNENSPVDLEVDRPLAECYHEMHRDDKAMQTYGRALRVASLVYPAGVPSITEQLLPLLKDTTAIDSLEEIAQEQHWHPFLTSALKGLVYKRKGDLPQAISAFDQSLKDGPVASGLRAWIFDEKASVLEEQKNYAQAIEEFENCLKIFRSSNEFPIRYRWLYAAAYLNKGYCQQCLGNYADAVDSDRQALSIDKSDPSPYKYLGECLVRLKRYDEAIPELTKAIRVEPKNSCAHHYLAECLVHSKRYDEAAKEWTKAIDADPHFHQSLRFSRGVTYLAMGKFKESAADTTSFLHLEGWHSQRSPYAAILLVLAYRLDHNDLAAEKTLLACKKKVMVKTWPSPVIGYLAGRSTIDDLKNASGSNVGKLTETYTYVGLDLRAKNKTDQARKYLQWVADHGNKDYLEYELAIAFLDRELGGKN
jgi:serine/threonine protein kinase/Tfp pilus assembly protein PilF